MIYRNENIHEAMIKLAGAEHRLISELTAKGFPNLARALRKSRRRGLRRGTSTTTMPHPDVLPAGNIGKDKFGKLFLQGKSRAPRWPPTPGTQRQLATVSPKASPAKRRLSGDYMMEEDKLRRAVYDIRKGR